MVKFKDLIKEASKPPELPPISSFTPRAQQAIVLARKEADRLGHDFVGTEHLLLGLINLGRDGVARVLEEMGLDLEVIRKKIESEALKSLDRRTSANIPYTPRVKKVIALAQKEARNLHHTYVGTDHLLLGLLREAEGMAAKVLLLLGVDLVKARQGIIKGLEPIIIPPSEPEPPQSAPAPSEQIFRDATMSNFTPRACQVLVLARKEADRLNHNFLGTEHLLLGLIKLGQGIAVNVLQKMGLDLEIVRMEVEKQVPSSPDQKMIGNIPYTPRVRRVIALTQKEANKLHHTFVGTEHLLLGLLAEGDGVAAKVLRALNVNIERARQEVLKELDPNYSLSSEL